MQCSCSGENKAGDLQPEEVTFRVRSGKQMSFNRASGTNYQSGEDTNHSVSFDSYPVVAACSFGVCSGREAYHYCVELPHIHDADIAFLVRMDLTSLQKLPSIRSFHLP
jgi:hypothetical protein